MHLRPLVFSLRMVEPLKAVAVGPCLVGKTLVARAIAARYESGQLIRRKYSDSKGPPNPLFKR